MKSTTTLTGSVIGFFCLLLSACGGGSSDTTAPPPPPAAVTVSVTNGTADGYSAPGDTVHVLADTPADGQVFDHWTGDSALLANANAWHSTFVLGSSSVQLTAVFRSTPIWTPGKTVINGVDFWYYLPPNPIGLILCFHGAGGTGPFWFVQPENLRFLNDAVAQGFGVAALTSRFDDPDVTPASDPNAGSGWNLSFDLQNYPNSSSTNPDIQNVKAALDFLSGAGLVTITTPLFAEGISNGGRISVRVAGAMTTAVTGYSNFLAVNNHVSQGDPAPLMQSFTIPTRFDMQINDHVLNDIVNYQLAQSYSQGMNARGVPSEFVLNMPSPVYPKRFTRVFGLGEADSLSIYTALKQGGYLDAHDYIVMKGPSGSDPNDPLLNPSSWQSLIPAPYNQNAQTLRFIQDELHNAYAEHGFFSDYDDRDLAFFKARLP